MVRRISRRKSSYHIMKSCYFSRVTLPSQGRERALASQEGKQESLLGFAYYRTRDSPRAAESSSISDIREAKKKKKKKKKKKEKKRPGGLPRRPVK